jgi:hypothetical protein
MTDDRKQTMFAVIVAHTTIDRDQRYHSADGAEGKFLWSSSPQNVDLLPQRPNLCLKHNPRPDQIDNHPTQPAKIPHCARSSSDSRPTAKRDKVCDRDRARSYRPMVGDALACQSCDVGRGSSTKKRPWVSSMPPIQPESTILNANLMALPCTVTICA